MNGLLKLMVLGGDARVTAHRDEIPAARYSTAIIAFEFEG